MFRIMYVAILAIGISMSAASSPVRGDDLADVFPRAREMVARHLSSAELKSAYGTPAFTAQGNRIGDVFLNFCGQGRDGAWMLMSLTVHPDGTVTGENEPGNPRPDNWGHYLKPSIDLVAWPAPEESVQSAVSLHAEHQPVDGVSMAYFVSGKHHGRAVLVLYWLRDKVIYDVVTDAKYGSLISTGETQVP